LISHPQAISTIFGVRHTMVASSAVVRTPGLLYVGEGAAHGQPFCAIFRTFEANDSAAVGLALDAPPELL
jgi:hypothetical protein